MATPTQDLLSILLNQGVAVFVLVFLLVRLEARMAKLEALLQALADRAYYAAGGDGPPPSRPNIQRG